MERKRGCKALTKKVSKRKEKVTHQNQKIENLGIYLQLRRRVC